MIALTGRQAVTVSDNGEVARKEATQCVGSEAGVFDIFLSLIYFFSFFFLLSKKKKKKKKKVVREKKL